ncbi:hypothetical protein [Variovorax sp. RKNM96]|nr:hypothetical protein [Variovorax sp. RKNM96]
MTGSQAAEEAIEYVPMLASNDVHLISQTLLSDQPGSPDRLSN